MVSLVFHSSRVLIFILAPAVAHLPEGIWPVAGPGIIVVDRYKRTSCHKVKSGLILLAFCWVLALRYFLAIALSWPDQEACAMGWVYTRRIVPTQPSPPGHAITRPLSPLPTPRSLTAVTAFDARRTRSYRAAPTPRAAKVL